MFWKRKESDKKDTKLAGPAGLAEPVKKVLESNPALDPVSVRFYKSVSKPGEKDPRIQDIRVFDPSDAEAQVVRVLDYTTLSANPGLIIAEGTYDEAAKKAELSLKKNNLRIKLPSYDEILKQIEALKEPGSSVFFYQNAGVGIGGPLGRGAAVIRRNPELNSAGKKQKPYSIYGATVVDMLPAKESKVFDADKPVEIAKWVVNSLKPREW